MITVLGASGFIGSHLVQKIRALGVDCYAPARGENLKERNLGLVIYCIGLTADFRSRTFDTVEAHVCKLLKVVKECEFDSLLYLSSTRVYCQQDKPAREEVPLRLSPLDKSGLYNISKAMGESLSLNCRRPARVVRLSNVYGNDFASENFLSTIIRAATLNGKVVLRTSLDSAKDYISVEDVVELLIKIALEGRQRIYNLASGINVSNLELTEKLSELTGCAVETIPNAPRLAFSPINIDLIRDEFGFQPGRLLDDMKRLVALYGTQQSPR